jgi:hypothetical protein
MAGLIYGACALAALLCASLLLRAYRRSRYRLLLWSGLCFVGLTLNNLLVVVDELITPFNLATPRIVVALVATLILVYGLIWDAE